MVIDDASTDNTKEVAKSFKDKRVHYLRHEKNKGVSATRNLGIKYSKGEFIAFLDDDDMWLPKKLERQLNIIENNHEIGVIYTGSLFISDGRVYCLHTPSRRGDIFYEVLKKNIVGGPSTVLVRKECLNKIGFFDCQLPPLEDWDLWIRLAKHFKFDFVYDHLVLYRFHGTNPYNELKGRRLMFKKYTRELQHLRKIRGLWYYKIGLSYYRSGKMNEARNEFINAIKNDPYSILYYVSLSYSFLGSKMYGKVLTKFINVLKSTPALAQRFKGI